MSCVGRKLLPSIFALGPCSEGACVQLIEFFMSLHSCLMHAHITQRGAGKTPPGVQLYFIPALLYSKVAILIDCSVVHITAVKAGTLDYSDVPSRVNSK